MMTNELIITEDGCHSFLSKQFGVSYHSIHGALNETNRVFIELGLEYLLAKNPASINIFEMGFGTGLNALCTYNRIKKLPVKLSYKTCEAYPITKEQYSTLNFVNILEDDSLQEVFNLMHEVHSDIELIYNNFTFTKYLVGIEELIHHSTYDLVYYDAFAPNAQPELWTDEAMKRMYDVMNGNGILVTYCAKGEFKRVLKRQGFTVESHPGPGRKREITRAIKLI